MRGECNILVKRDGKDDVCGKPAAVSYPVLVRPLQPVVRGALGCPGKETREEGGEGMSRNSFRTRVRL